MKIKLYYALVSGFLSLSISVQSQEISTGRRTNLQSKEAVSAFYTNTVFTKHNIYYNQYSIFTGPDLKKADTAYVIYLNFNKDKNTIEILQRDKLSGLSKSETLKFNVLSYLTTPSTAKPIYCVKDNLFNDTLLSVSKDNNASILFTIADTTNPQIFLHQLVTLDGGYKYDLDKFRKSYLTPHISHASDYWLWYSADMLKRQQDSLLYEKTKSERMALFALIETENRNIDSDKDTLVTRLDEKWRELKMMDVPANPKSQKLFTEKMNSIFEDYLSKTDSFNLQIQVQYKIRSRIDHSIEIIKKISPGSNNYFQFLFERELERIDTAAIQHLSLENEKYVLFSEDSVNAIQLKHDIRSEKLRTMLSEHKFSFDSIFSAKNIAVNNVLKLYPAKVEMPTVYEYTLNYKSESERQKWVLNNKKLNDQLDSIVTNTKNLAFFSNKYPKAKNGKYNVRVNSTFLNQTRIGPELDYVKRKYKYASHAGVSYGTFISNEKHVEGDPTYDQKLTYWNVFLIYHRIGIFGGFSPNSQVVTDSVALVNYREGGIYVAPGNYLYFKLGVAKDTRLISTTEGEKSSVMPLVGASLIFPVFHIEGGFNLALNLPYVMAGFNIPLNH
jgi:hypothetical protein